MDTISASSGQAVVIGLDVGTTAVKAVAFEVGSSWLHAVSQEYGLASSTAGLGVQDPGAILAAASRALSDCVAGIGWRPVLAVSVSAAMHGLIALGAGCVPLTPLITWADDRAAGETRALHRSGEAAALHALTGVPVHPMSPLMKLRWFARHDRVTWSAARWWLGLKDYVLWWLTGRIVTELSSASGTGLLGIAERTWSPAALEACGVDSERLPEILPTTAVLAIAPVVAATVGLEPGTPVVVGAADGPLGNLGTGAISPGIAGLSLGTSGAVRIAVAEPRVQAGLFCYALTDSVWIAGGALSNGGAVMRWFGRAIAPDLRPTGRDQGVDAVMLRLAGSVPAGSEGLILLPYLVPERAPLWSPDLHGAYLGLRPEHTRAHLARAAVEGVCLQMRVILARLDAVDPVRVVHATGGAFRSDLWREVMAAAIGRPLVIVDDTNGTARGAAALALYALGRAPTLTAAVALLDGGTAANEGALRMSIPDPELVKIYDAVFASAAETVRGLAAVTEAMQAAGVTSSSRGVSADEALESAEPKMEDR